MKSEKNVVESPMGFAGSTNRIWRLSENVWVRWLVLIWLVMMAWSIIAVWYMFFSLLLLSWRLIRRSQRKARVEQLRHQEMLEHLKSR